jgi:hypothetical protein
MWPDRRIGGSAFSLSLWRQSRHITSSLGGIGRFEGAGSNLIDCGRYCQSRAGGVLVAQKIHHQEHRRQLRISESRVATYFVGSLRLGVDNAQRWFIVVAH